MNNAKDINKNISIEPDEIDIKELLKNEQSKIDNEENYDPTNTTKKYDRYDNTGNTGNIGNKSNINLVPNNLTTVNIKSIYNLDTVYKIQRALHPQAQYIKNYIVLDSTNRDISNSDTYNMQWSYMNDAIFQQGTVNTKGKIRDLIGMRLYPIRISYNNNTLYGFPTVPPFYTLGITEFNSQSFIAQQGRKFHFMLRPTLTTDFDQTLAIPYPPPLYDYTELTPLNDGYFWFRKPYTSINTITITMGSPLVPMQLPINIYILPPGFTNTNPAILSYGVVGGFQLATGNLIRVTGYTTANPIADAAAIAAINNPDGLTITVIDPYTFSVPVDLTGITQFGPYDLYVPNMTITTNALRLIVPLELIYIDSPTNTIDD